MITQSIKNTILYILLMVAFLAFVYMTQYERLVLYDRYYLCMYQDWDYERCTLLVYGVETK